MSIFVCIFICNWNFLNIGGFLSTRGYSRVVKCLTGSLKCGNNIALKILTYIKEQWYLQCGSLLLSFFILTKCAFTLTFCDRFSPRSHTDVFHQEACSKSRKTASTD